MSHASFWIAAHGAALLGYLAIAHRWIRDHALFPRLEPHGVDPLPVPAPKVSVVVPARDEESTIGACLERLCASRYPALEVLVVNDQSSDRTGEIAAAHASRDPRVRVIDGTQRPEGWTGKNWAIHQGATAATGELLLIVDADTELEPRAIPEAVARLEARQLDLLTVFPRIRLGSFWERAVLPALGLIPSFRLDRINDPGLPDANAVGYFLLFRRSAFDALGGYAAIRGRVGEDWVVAHRLKDAGRRLEMVLAPDLVRKGFGPSLADIWQGFVKNFMLILEEKRVRAVLAAPLVALLAVFLVMPWLACLQGIVVAGLTPGAWRTAAALVGLGLAELFVVQSVRRAMELTAGIADQAIHLQPLGAAVVLAMWATAIARTLAGLGLTWRGRTYRRI